MKWRPPGRRKRGRPKGIWAEGITGLMGEKGLMEGDWNDRDRWKKKIIVKWAQEGVETLNDLLNNNNNTYILYICTYILSYFTTLSASRNI